MSKIIRAVVKKNIYFDRRTYRNAGSVSFTSVNSTEHALKRYEITRNRCIYNANIQLALTLEQ